MMDPITGKKILKGLAFAHDELSGPLKQFYPHARMGKSKVSLPTSLMQASTPPMQKPARSGYLSTEADGR